MRRLKNQHLDRGFTTVELIVGLLLSLFIISVSITYFISSSQTFKSNTNESVVQENGRFALEYLASSLRHAGVNPSNAIEHELDIVFTGNLCAATEAGLAAGAAGSTTCTLDGANNTTQNNSDRVAIDYVIDASRETSALVTQGCNAQSITVPAGQQWRAASVYWTADLDDDGVRSLYCQMLNLETNVAVGAALAIVDGIDRLQVQYGADADGDGVIEGYRNITNLGAANTDQIRSMRVAILVNSGLFQGDAETERTTAELDTQFRLLDGASESLSDNKLYRQVFSTTVMVHNVFSEVFADTP